MKAKTFDCVRMKHEIQQQILAEMKSLSPEERRRKTEQAIESDPILRRFWKRRRQAGESGRRMSES